MEVVNSPPSISSDIIKKISDRYGVLIFVGKTKDDDIYVRLDKIYVINKKFLFVGDTGYGPTYELACKDLIKFYLNPEYRLRYNELYATSTIRSIIRNMYKKYNRKAGEIDGQFN